MGIQAEEDLVVGVWSEYWKSKLDSPPEPWDSLSQIVLSTLLRERPGPAILEAGCGTGRISLRLARSGAQVTCLDATEEALELARAAFGEVPATFLKASIFEIPEMEPQDLIWSSGVLEHFHPEEQRTAIAQFVARLKPTGKVVLLNPYAGSLLYRAAKAYLEWRKKWPYGREIPVKTMAGCLPPGAVLEREYTVSFLPFFLNAYKFAPALQPFCAAAQKMLFGLLGDERVARLDAWLSRLLGGYLCVSVIRR